MAAVQPATRTTPLHDTPFPSTARLSAIGWFPFDEDDIRRCLHREVDKGRPYQRRGAVRELRADKGGQRLIASVQGTRPRPYHVFVDIGTSDPVSLTGRCSCPIGLNCKHAAAVLLEALQNPPRIEHAAADPLVGPIGGWLQLLRQTAAAHAPTATEEIAYRLDAPPQPGMPLVIEARIVRLLKAGGWGAGRSVPTSQLQNPTANYLRPDDRAIFRLCPGAGHSSLPIPEDPDVFDLLMRRMIATGRCCWQDLGSPPLTLGPARHGRLAWRLAENGAQTLAVELDGGPTVALPSASPWYVLPDEHLAGPIAFEVARPLVKIALSAPPVTIAQAKAVAAALEREMPGLALPRPRTDLVEEVREEAPVPTLLLATRKLGWSYWDAGSSSWEQSVDLALLGYSYGGKPINAENSPRELRSFEDGRIIVRRRDLEAERAARRRLEGFGLRAVERAGSAGLGSDRIVLRFPEGPAEWPGFVYEALPQLEREGWRIEIEDGFRHRVVDAGGEWTAEVEDGGGWWFSLDLGIEIDGQRVPLLPVLTSLLGRARDLASPSGLDALASNGTVFGQLADGRHVALPLERTKAILSTLVELYHPGSLSDRGQDGGFGRCGDGPRRGRSGDPASLARRRAAAGIGRTAVGFFRDRRGSTAGRVADRAAPLSARRSRLAAIPARLRAGRHPRRRYGAGEDRTGARPYPGREARGPARPALPRRLPDERGAELARRGRAAGAGIACPVIARRRPRAAFRRDRRPRLGGDDLCAACRATPTVCCRSPGTSRSSTRRRRSRTPRRRRRGLSAGSTRAIGCA